jgi:DNA-binding beta-propeller fold protein YncE
VAAVLRDAEHRVAVLGGREGMPRSLGSVYGGSVTRFLGGSLRGVVSRVIDTSCVRLANGVAVSRDGSTLLVPDCSRESLGICVLSVAHNSLLRVIGGTLRLKVPCAVSVAPDGFVFVADSLNDRVQVLTPSLRFNRTIGQGLLMCPVGVCANADVVVVSECWARRIAVFNRGDGALVRHVGNCGSGDGQLMCPRGLCFMSGDRHVAVADADNNRVSVFSIDGEFIRHIGVGLLSRPAGVAASAFDELVVADPDSGWLRVFSSADDPLVTVGESEFRGVAVQGSTVFAVFVDADADAAAVSVFG